MTAYSTVQALKNAINDTIYANDAGLVTAEAMQERLHDIIDTLVALGGLAGVSDLTALQDPNDLTAIYAGVNKVATESWVTNQGYAAGNHNHDDRYYTESEIDDLLAALPEGGAALPGNWTFDLSGNDLVLKYSGTALFIFKTTGESDAVDDIIADHSGV